MPKYKLKEGNGFISLTLINDDDSALVINCGREGRISFGSYQSGIQRKLELSRRQVMYAEQNFATDIPEAELFSTLLQENILESMLNDQEFLKTFESIIANNDFSTQALTSLKQRKFDERCFVNNDIGSNSLMPFRTYAINFYINYFLNRPHIRINADPLGSFIEIQINSIFRYEIDPSNKNDVSSELSLAQQLWQQVHHLKQPSLDKMSELNITESPITSAVLPAINAIFNQALQQGFFPTNPTEVIKTAWQANNVKRGRQISPWRPGSPTLLSAPNAWTLVLSPGLSASLNNPTSK